MRIIFAGTPDFAKGVLKAIYQAKYNIVGVYTQPDRPKGRGRILSVCPVKQQALEFGLDVFQPENLTAKNTQEQLHNLNADIMVVVAYGQILPIAILKSPKYGCLNIHASLLPKWRGASPIQRAIINGDKHTGIGIMQMDAGLDTGDILLQKTCDITTLDTAKTLHDKLAVIGADCIIKALDNIDNLTPIAQNKSGVTYAKKLSKDEAWIDWSKSAVEINQQIRAFNPYPIAQTNAISDKFTNKTLRILSANVVQFEHKSAPGEIVKYAKGICIVATGNGALSLQTIQLAGKKVADIKDFTNAYKLTKLSCRHAS